MNSRRRQHKLFNHRLPWSSGAATPVDGAGGAGGPVDVDRGRVRRVIAAIDLLATGLAFLVVYPYPILPYLLVAVVVTSLWRFQPGLAALVISLGIMAWEVFRRAPDEWWDPGAHNLIALALMGGFCLGLRRVLDELERQRLKEQRLVRELSEAIEKLREGERQQAAAQEQLLRSERLAALGQFSATVAHELRNPLNVVKLAAHHITNHVPAEDEKLQRSLIHLNQHVDRACEIISDLLSFARFPPPRCAATSINDVVCRAVAALPASDRVSVDLSLAPHLPLVMADRRQIEQALENLGLNALQAMSEGGRLTVTTRVEDPYIEITVRDTGPGIPEEVQERVFEPFFSTKVTGTGLGLPLVQAIAAAHGGRVHLTSDRGEGACFVLALPLPAIPAAPVAAPEAEPAGSTAP